LELRKFVRIYHVVLYYSMETQAKSYI